MLARCRMTSLIDVGLRRRKMRNATVKFAVQVEEASPAARGDVGHTAAARAAFHRCPPECRMPLRMPVRQRNEACRTE